MSDAPEQSPSGFTRWAVWRRNPDAPVVETDSTELESIVAHLADAGVTVRGFYDVSGLKAEGDLMVWLHGDTAEDLQRALHRSRAAPPRQQREVQVDPPEARQ